MRELKKSLKMKLSLVLSCAITLSNISFIAQAEDFVEGNVIASVSNDKISIGNDYIKREFSIVDGKVLTSLIENNRANTKIIPQFGSEDFIINTIQQQEQEPESPKPIIPTEVLNRTNWKATLTVNNGTAYPESSVSMLFDGNKGSYVDNYQISGYPTSLKIDLGEESIISSFSYLKRPGYQDSAYGLNGTMGQYRLYVSNDGANWKEAGSGEFTRNNYNLHQEGALYNVGDIVYGNFDKAYTTRYIRIDQLSDALGNTQEFTAAEFNLFSDKYEVVEVPIIDNKIKSSNLIIDDENTRVEEIENGKKLTISYEPYNFKNIEYKIDMVTVLESDDHYMRSFLEIKTNNNSSQIDYIDLDHFVLDNEIKNTIWSHPDLKDVSSMWIGKNELMLGQPIYANGMFFGSEFPAADTDMVNNEMQIRYYSGKTFDRLSKDNQLTTDGKFISWQNVVGAAKGIDTDVVQTDFYEYISEIATPTDFRKQYNSWYDNMLGITDESIAKSFYGSEKGLTENGVEPVDSYVVDDGWNNYRDSEFNTNVSEADAGEGVNRTGFWEFNSKFPNELYTSAELAQKFQSKFGVWVGPQGGYNYFSGFAKYLEKMGTGYMQKDYWTNVCVGSDKYVKNLTSMFIDYQARFDVDYWKIDGFAVRPCTNPDHDHMTGGTNNAYYTTDLWEKWTDAWDAMRASRAAEGKELFINATCYVNLSPWLLQWVNTVWVQDSGDTGQAGTGERHQQKITYRDNVYYNLFKVNQLQFPLKNIYNHDPIYGVSDGSSSTTEDFRDFLFANAVRGTAFWELYYSPSIMDAEKWQVNADALDFAETNAHILEKAKLFGNRATQGVYGYSSWDGDEGIISFRNPTGEVKEFTLQLIDVVGVSKSVKDLKANQVLPYVAGEAGTVSYGDSVTVELKPYETRIIQYGKNDNEGAQIVSSKVTGNNEITIKYNERVSNIKDAYSVEGNIVTETNLLDDYRTVVIKTETTLVNNAVLNVNGEKDSVGNVSTMTLTIPVYNDSKIVSIESNEDLADGENITKKYNGNLDSFFFDMDKSYKVNINKTFEGITDFGISMSVNTISSGVNLFKQGEDINLSIDEEGYLNFKVKDLNVSSKEEVTTVIEKAHGTFGTDEYVPTSIKTTLAGKINDGRLHQITAVREVNGMIKLYVDGELASSVYDKSKVNQSINSGELEVADDNFRGILGGIEFRNSSIYYDEVKERYDKYNEVPVIEYDRNDWIASACSEMLDSTGDGPASSAIDGNENSWWHTNYIGTDQHSENHWISIDFSKEISFDSIDVLSRGKSSNGTIKQYKLEAKVNGVWEVVKEGEFTDGKTDKIELENSIKASVIRLTSISTFNGQNFAAIKEIYVSQKDRLATQEEINEVISLVQEIDENNYTKATVNNYKKVASKITSLDVANIQVLNMLKAQLELAYSSLLESKDLNDLITISEMLDKEYYTEESWVKFNDALNNAKVVINNIESTEENVNNAKIELENAINNLVIKEDDTEKVDKTGLGKVVEYAEDAKLNGALEEVVPAVINEFEAALKEAKDVLADDNATEAQVDEATKRLVNVIHMLEFKKGDKAELKKLVQIINALDQSKYTPATWTSLQATFEEANNVIANENAMEEEVNEAYEKLVKAYLDLRLIADKAKLQELINKSENIDISKYTKESVNKFNLSLANGKSVLAKEEVTQEEVDKAVKELTLALAGLEVKQENSGNNNNDDNNDTSGEKGSNNNLPSTGGSSPMALGLFATLMSIAGVVTIKRKNK
ncbi:discoidin domain-containing protein [Clostridium sartagoforme]|uniref:discoidin domain-containing protein n=1 Tax=Clostridium sartagoforme TaxID=84031 RepID=UPI0031DF9AB4